MRERKAETRIPRREFLKTAGLAAGAAGVAGAALSGRSAEAATAQPTGRPRVGYRETEHVRTYYDLARF